MLYSEIIAVCSQIHTKHINTLCGQNVESLQVEPGDMKSKHVSWHNKLLRTTHIKPWMIFSIAKMR
jgi:hypothetical protein